jgi:hypothetical protein
MSQRQRLKVAILSLRIHHSFQTSEGRGSFIALVGVAFINITGLINGWCFRGV